MSEDYYKFHAEAKSGLLLHQVERKGASLAEQTVESSLVQNEPVFAAVMAIDWADKNHYWSLQAEELEAAGAGRWTTAGSD